MGSLFGGPERDQLVLGVPDHEPEHVAEQLVVVLRALHGIEPAGLVLDVDQLEQVGQLAAEAAHAGPAVGHRVDAPLGPRRVAAALDEDAVVLPAAGAVLEHRGAALLQRDVDQVALALHHGADEGDGRGREALEAAEHQRLVAAGLQRGAVGLAGERHDPADGERDDVRGPVRRVRPVETERRDRRDDEVRVVGEQLCGRRRPRANPACGRPSTTTAAESSSRRSASPPASTWRLPRER